MTCTEVLTNIEKDPMTCTAAERAATAIHVNKCPACIAELNARAKEAKRIYALPENRAKRAALARKVDVALDQCEQDMHDPEIREMIEKARKELL